MDVKTIIAVFITILLTIFICWSVSKFGKIQDEWMKDFREKWNN